MSKLVKDLITNELRTRYGALDSALWVELLGVNGIVTNELRRDLHGRQIRLEVIQNGLFRRAVHDRPLGKLAERLVGPAALVTGGDSLVDVAKVLEAWLPRISGLKLRGAVLEGEFLDAQAATGLSKLPTKRDMQARIAGLIRSPGAQLAAALLSGGGRIAGCVKALAETLEKSAPEPQAA
jgi:large subunit ribosomal protein L10